VPKFRRVVLHLSSGLNFKVKSEYSTENSAHTSESVFDLIPKTTATFSKIYIANFQDEKYERRKTIIELRLFEELNQEHKYKIKFL
jgi:hypothetical protein